MMKVSKLANLIQVSDEIQMFIRDTNLNFFIGKQNVTSITLHDYSLSELISLYLTLSNVLKPSEKVVCFKYTKHKSDHGEFDEILVSQCKCVLEYILTHIDIRRWGDTVGVVFALSDQSQLEHDCQAAAQLALLKSNVIPEGTVPVPTDVCLN